MADLHSVFVAAAGTQSSVKIDEAGKIAQRVGYIPTLRDVAELKTKHGATVTESQVAEWVKSLARTDDCKAADLLAVFEEFDPERNGTVPWRHLHKIMTSVGEPLSEDEAAEMQKTFCPDGKLLDYRKMVQQLCRGS